MPIFGLISCETVSWILEPAQRPAAEPGGGKPGRLQEQQQLNISTTYFSIIPALWLIYEHYFPACFVHYTFLFLSESLSSQTLLLSSEVLV